MPYTVDSNLDEFAEHHSYNYDQTDDLIDVDGNVEWRDMEGNLRGILLNHSVSEVMNWVYINLK